MSGPIAERLAEAVGPIVVKEVRQGLRARVFAICFGLLLCACLIVALVAAAESVDASAQVLGPRYLTLFLCGLSLVCFLVIPYTAFRSMVSEQEDETWVLLVLTGLSSRRIVRGKVISALSQALLYASAGAPFMVFSYFLNGVDLPTLLLELVFACSWAVFLTCLAVALGTEARSRISRAGLHFAMLALLAGATVGAMAFGGVMANEGARWFDDTSFVVFATAFPLVLLTTSVVLLEAAAAGLSLASESSVRGVRWVVVGQHLLALALTAAGVALTTMSSGRDLRAVPIIGSMLTSLMLVVVGLFSISERDGYPRRQRDRRSWLTSGALRGWRLVIGLLVLDTLGWAAIYFLTIRHAEDRYFYGIFAAPAYVALYLSLAVVLGKLSPLRRLGEPNASRAGLFIGVLAAMVIPPVVAVLSHERATAKDYNHLNPFIGLVNFADHNGRDISREGLLQLAIGCLVFGTLAWVLLARRDRERPA